MAGIALTWPPQPVAREVPVHCELLVAGIPAYWPEVFKVPLHRPTFPPDTSGPMAGQGAEPHQLGGEERKNDAGKAPMPAAVSPRVGTEFGYVLAPVGTSDVLPQVEDHPVSEELPHHRTVAVTVS